MTAIRTGLLFCMLLLALGQTAPALAQAAYYSGPMEKLDLSHLYQQRERVDQVFGQDLGRAITRTQRDLDGLQRMLDRGLVAKNDNRMLQAMGVVLGDVLATELGLHWVIYEDKKGRSRALQLDDSDLFIFPVTMIERRYVAGAKVDVAAIYQQARQKVLDASAVLLPYDARRP